MGSKQTKTASQRSATHFGTLKLEQAVYTGCMVAGRRHGHGEILFSDGRKFVGNFEDGMVSGHGTYTCPDGTKYVGDFLNNKRHGNATYTRADGHVR